MIISLEPESSPRPLSIALQRLKDNGRETGAFESFAIILQAINVACQRWLAQEPANLSKASQTLERILRNIYHLFTYKE